MLKTILLIDGQNFLHKIDEVLKSTASKKEVVEVEAVNLNKLLINPLKGIQLNRKLFYGAKLHYNSDTPIKSTRLIKSQRKLINSLKKQEFEFIMAGNVRAQKVDGKVIFREKRVDVRIAVDMVSLACDKKVESIILCSSDSDLQPAISEVRKRKVKVFYLGFENNPNKGLTYTTDRTILIRNSEVIAAFDQKKEKRK